jgi:hypothetical protein
MSYRTLASFKFGPPPSIPVLFRHELTYKLFFSVTICSTSMDVENVLREDVRMPLPLVKDNKCPSCSQRPSGSGVIRSAAENSEWGKARFSPGESCYKTFFSEDYK